MNEWMNGWVGGWVSEWVNKWMNEWVGGWVDEWMNEWMDGWMDGWMNGWTNGWMENEWMDGWNKEWMNEEGEKEREKERKSILTFLMPALYFSHKDLNEVELKIKCLLTKKGARHPQHLNTLLYASRLIGGRGLRELTNIYKIKIKSALRITTSKYPKLQAVGQFQQAEEVKEWRSMLKDTKKCAVDTEDDLRASKWSQTFIWNNRKADLHCPQTETLRKRCWPKGPRTWRSKRAYGRGTLCPTDLMKQLNFQRALIGATYTICSLNEIYQQILRIKYGRKWWAVWRRRPAENVTRQFSETVEHILSGCPELVQRLTIPLQI